MPTLGGDQVAKGSRDTRPCLVADRAWRTKAGRAVCSGMSLQTAVSCHPGGDQRVADQHPDRVLLVAFVLAITDSALLRPEFTYRTDELRAAGCATVLEQHAYGSDRGRPVLARLLREIRPGETLVVVRLDRLARSVAHLLAVIDQLEARGAQFRSLRDPTDTPTPQGMFSLQVLGAVAQLKRALIAERTKAGLSAARKGGRVGRNPGCEPGDPDAIRKLRASRSAGHLAGVPAGLDAWLPMVHRMRPSEPWGDVVRVLDRDQAGTWTVERLRRTVRRLVAEGHRRAEAAGPRPSGSAVTIGSSDWLPTSPLPRRTALCSRSPSWTMRERTPRGGTRWHPSSVKHLLTRAISLGLARNAPGRIGLDDWR